jgi:hypothetical protein
MHLVVTSDGSIRCLYDEALDLFALGRPTIARGSYVEPDGGGQWQADLSPVGGPLLGRFDRRSEALAAERAWLEAHWLVPQVEPATERAPLSGTE